MAKVLVTAHLGRHFRVFGHYDYRVLLDMGYEVHIAANFRSEIDEFDDPFITKHQIDFDRRPLSPLNIEALRQVKALCNKHDFDIIHCQSPTGGAITRLAASEARARGTKIIYTAHGFHFFRGAPLANWVVYHNAEKLLARFTDTIITINDEDYRLALKLPVKEVRQINGVGVDLDKFTPQTSEKRAQKRKEFGYGAQDFVLIYVGELSYRKHQDLVITAVAKLRNRFPNLRLLLVGNGSLSTQYRKLVDKLGLSNHVHFLGYRKDVADIMLVADVAVSSSRQEGLPVNVMEAMATGLPLVVTDCRGNRDLVRDGTNGFVVGPEDAEAFAMAISELVLSEALRERMRDSSLTMIGNYSKRYVQEQMRQIYSHLWSNTEKESR